MDIASVCILIFLLIFCIMGYAKGLVAIILRVCKGIASIIVSFFLSEPCGKLLFNSNIGERLTNNIEGKICESLSSSNIVITSENAAESIGIALNEMNIPEFLHKIIQKLVLNNVNDYSGHTLGHYISSALSMLACTIIAFVVLMIIINIAFFLLRRLFKGINYIPFVGFINRISGCVANFLFAWLIISISFWIISFLSTFMPELNEFTNTYLISVDGNKTIASWFYEHNLATILYIKFIK